MRIIYFLVAGLVTFSYCTPEKIVTNNYLYNIKDSIGNFTVNMPEPIIQKNDLLHIRVFSLSTDPKVDIPYNLPEQSVSGSSVSPVTGFLVDYKGEINYPGIGIIQVEGLTRQQLADIIKQRLSQVLKEPSVIVRFLNYRITVLGEVKAPGSFTSPTERVTVLDALGLAGDVTEFGDRTTVRVAREKNGQIEYGQVDLTSKDLFTSPYFRLQQNDVVFVDQTSRRIRQQEQQTVAQQVGIASSVITAIALILNLIR